MSAEDDWVYTTEHVDPDDILIPARERNELRAEVARLEARLAELEPSSFIGGASLINEPAEKAEARYKAQTEVSAELGRALKAAEARVMELENLLPTALERDQMRKVCKYAEMVHSALAATDEAGKEA